MTETDLRPNAQPNLNGGVVHPWHLDQFGHMNVRWYAHIFDDASFLFWNRLGLDLSMMTDRLGVHTVTAKSTMHFQAELLGGTCYQMSGEVTGIGTKSVTLALRLTSDDGRIEHAVYEVVEVFVDADTHRSIKIPETVRARLETALVERGLT